MSDVEDFAHTPVERGLTADEVKRSRELHGENLLQPPARTPWWLQYLRKFDDPIIKILMIATLISFFTGQGVEAVGIMVAIMLATTLAFINEFKAEKEFDILNRVNDEVPVKVRRSGGYCEVPGREIVVGDIVILEQGEEIPADGEVLEAVDLQVDQSRLTGESEPVAKMTGECARRQEMREETYPAWMLLKGTPVVQGHGICRVTAVGAGTEIGHTAREAMKEESGDTPLARQLQRLSNLVGVIGMGMAAITFIALTVKAAVSGQISQTAGQWGLTVTLALALVAALVRIWIPPCADVMRTLRPRAKVPAWMTAGSRKIFFCGLLAALLIIGAGLAVVAFSGNLPESISQWLAPEAVRRFTVFFMVAVALVVMAMPEGLAMSVTLSLAYSMRKMTASNNLVRRMHACETIGAATVICTDKTGTLTMNQMRVDSIHSPLADSPEAAWSMAVNSTANLAEADGGEPQPIGNPTEGALLIWLHSQKHDYGRMRASFTITHQWPFSTERKYMATSGHAPEIFGGREVLLVKGAPEILVGHCTAFADEAQNRIPMDAEARERLMAKIMDYQQRGMRTLGFCYRVEPELEDATAETVAEDLVWLGFAAIADPVRPDVPAAIQRCRKAGIQVKMVTGDSPETAMEIGRQIKIITENDAAAGTVITGREFQEMSDGEALKAAASIRIMARARPNDKLRLVRCLKQLGEVVAVTGDGTNDAPALNSADVGIAMGKTGTSIAKEAADIILLDDSFTSIVNAVMWGRSLYRNIQKFVLFQLNANVVALSIAALGPFIGIEMPLTVIQVLWVNLIMDTFAALALATDPPDEKVMDDRPRRSTDFIVTPPMAKTVLGFGAICIAVLTGMLFYMQKRNVLPGAEWSATDPESQFWLTSFFCVFVMLQFWNLFNAKCWGNYDTIFRHLADNRIFTGIAAAILAGQIIMVTWGGTLFRTIPLKPMPWFIIIAATSCLLWCGEIFRLICRMMRRRKQGENQL